MAEGKPSILVVGSINMDLVVRCPHMPSPGETVLGGQFVTSPGGKGANQAVGVARLGGACKFIGRVGQDAFGEQLLAGMKAEGVDCTSIIPTADAHTGVAMIFVDSKGENSIVVAAGANHALAPDDIFDRSDIFSQVQVVLLQLELPLPTVRAAVDLARRNNCKIILDPAPAPKVMPETMCMVDMLIPNAVEAEAITGRTTRDEREAKLVASDLIARGAKAAALTLGPRGSIIVTADGHFYTVPPYKVAVVDTTAAGDAYAAAMAVAMAVGEKIHQAAKFANAAGALACTKIGAQQAMPTLSEVRQLMEEQEI